MEHVSAVERAAETKAFENCYGTSFFLCLFQNY